MKKAIDRLQKAYQKGYTTYPRVKIDYINIEYIIAHPKLNQFDKYSYPLKKTYYNLSKDTIPLFLENYNISTPATLLRNYNNIFKYFNENLKPINENKLNEKIEKYKKFLHFYNSNFNDLKYEDNIIKKMNIKYTKLKHSYKIKNTEVKYMKNYYKNFNNSIFKNNINIEDIKRKTNYYYLLNEIKNHNLIFDKKMFSKKIYKNSKNSTNDLIYNQYNNDIDIWKHNIFIKYKKIKLLNFNIYNKDSYILFYGKNNYKESKFILKNNTIESINNINLNLKVKAMLEIAINLNWDLNSIRCEGSSEFKKAIKRELNRLKRNINVSRK